MFAKKLVLVLGLTALGALFATSSFAAKAKPTFYCDKSTKPPCIYSTATVNAKKTKISSITIKGPDCVRANGTVVEDFKPTFQKRNVSLTGKKKNKFSFKGQVTLEDSARKGPYSFPYTLSGTVKHGSSITGKAVVTGAVEPCANITTVNFTLKK